MADNEEEIRVNDVDMCPKCKSKNLDLIDADGVIFYDANGDIIGDHDWVRQRCRDCGTKFRMDW